MYFSSFVALREIHFSQSRNGAKIKLKSFVKKYILLYFGSNINNKTHFANQLMPRPELNDHLPVEDFKSFYWLKEELAGFYRSKGIYLDNFSITSIKARIFSVGTFWGIPPPHDQIILLLS